jgi:hypothetical protein
LDASIDRFCTRYLRMCDKLLNAPFAERSEGEVRRLHSLMMCALWGKKRIWNMISESVQVRDVSASL